MDILNNLNRQEELRDYLTYHLDCKPWEEPFKCDGWQDYGDDRHPRWDCEGTREPDGDDYNDCIVELCMLSKLMNDWIISKNILPKYN